MKPIKMYMKKKVYLKLIGFISFPVIVFLLIVILLVDIFGAILIQSETVNNDNYIKALENRQSKIEEKLEVNVDLAVYYGLDSVIRLKPYEQDEKIYVNQKHLACFIKNNEVISKDEKQEAYDCLNFDKNEINQFEEYYKLFNENSDYVETTNISNNSSFNYPVNEPYVITAVFNSNDSVHNGHHNGVDFVPLDNQSIISSTSGKIIEVEKSCNKYGGYLGSTCGSGFGNHIVLQATQDKTKYQVIYGHMADVKVDVGEKVKQGQVIGTVGNSGNTTGKHLHFQVERFKDNAYVPINPEELLSSSNISDDKKEILERAGVSAKDYKSVDFIISHESSWNYRAVNSSSGAYGLCQALPGIKMNSAGKDWKTNPVTQMKWCDTYAKARYRSWQKAEDFWQTNEWW